MMTDMRPAAESGRTRITLEVPTRGLLGYRNIFFTDTKVLLRTLARTVACPSNSHARLLFTTC